MTNRGILIVISGPSGVGKTTICERLLEDPAIRRVITCTTRPPRPQERQDVDYHFLDRAEFEHRIESGLFAEYAEVYGHLYGTPLDEIEEGIKKGWRMILNIDVQGARQLRDSGIDGMLTFFIAPPDFATLERRLRGRGNDSPAQVARRLEAARRELEELDEYDHVVVNQDLDETVAEIRRALSLETEREHARAGGGDLPDGND